MAYETTSPSWPLVLLGSHPMAGQPSIIFCPIKVAPINRLYSLSTCHVIPRQVGAERQAPLDPSDRSHRPALLGGVMGMKQTLHWHYWVLDPPHQPESLLIRTQTLQYHMSLGAGRGKEQQPDVHPAAHPAP